MMMVIMVLLNLKEFNHMKLILSIIYDVDLINKI